MPVNTGDFHFTKTIVLPVVPATKERNSNWRTLIEDWALPSGVRPRIAVSLQRERKANTAPSSVWELDWQDCPVAFRLRGLARQVISVKVPTLFPPSDIPILAHSPAQHCFIAHREDAAKVLLNPASPAPGSSRLNIRVVQNLSRSESAHNPFVSIYANLGRPEQKDQVDP